MKRVLASTYLIIACITYSCNTGSGENRGQDSIVQMPEKVFYDFDIRNTLDQSGELLLSSIASEIRYIPLETTPVCFLSGCRRVEIFHNNIYVKDKKALYKIDMDGSFNRQIGKIGNGPGEYGSVLWFNFIDHTNEIILYSYPTDRINIHDAESGEFKRSFRLDFTPCGIVEFPPGELAFFTWNTKQSENPACRSEIYICNLEGDIIDSIPDERIPNTGNINSPTRYYINNESLHYMGYFQDTLYSLSEDAVKESYASFGLKNKVHGFELEFKNLFGEIQFPDFLYVSERVLENKVSFFITVDKGLGVQIPIPSFKFFYDKTSDQLVNCTSIINDLDHGMPFWPQSIYNDSILIDFHEAIDFLEYFQTNSDASERTVYLNNLIDSLDENDNPIVVLAGQF